MIVWYDDGGESTVIDKKLKETVEATAANWRQVGSMRFKTQAIETLWDAGMKDAAFLVMKLPASGIEGQQDGEPPVTAESKL
jgi:hypothetical protein